NNFGIRKRLLEYDDVMNYQREAIYSRRRNAISGEKVEIDLQNMMKDTAALFVDRSKGLPFEEFEVSLMAQLSIDSGLDAETYERAKPAEIENRLVEHMQEVYRRRMETLVERLNPIIKDVFEKQGTMYQNIAIPISDGRKQMTLSVNLERAYNSEGREIAKTLSKNIILYQIDEHWKEHLREMDDLKQSVQNASYEQKDPVVVYKLESYNLFASMLETLNQDVLSFLFKAFVPLQDRPQQPQRAVRPKTDMSRYQTRHSDLTTNGEQKTNAPVKVDKQVGRNDPCPCGSGKKYKQCHGKGLV
ncbi:MAG: SEC-C domain-containing protein, partial [Bacteroidales bacterium]|nr:SEC-C domain-containing protein [Bacteroidales bacterium]